MSRPFEDDPPAIGRGCLLYALPISLVMWAAIGALIIAATRGLA